MDWFSKIRELAGQEYERYLPTAFDESLTLLEKVNKVIETLNQIVLGVNTVADYVDGHVDTQNEKIKQLRDDFEILKEWLENEGLEERTTQVLNEWFDNGRLAQIINNDVFDMKADKATFEQFVLSTTTQLQQTEQSLNAQLTQKANTDHVFTTIIKEGAKGDGQTDDSDSFISQLNIEGNTVYVPNGDFLITKPLHFAKNVNLIGSKNTRFLIQGDTDLFKVNKGCKIDSIKIKTLKSDYSGNMFEISSNTIPKLSGGEDWTYPKLDVYIDNIDVETANAVGNDTSLRKCTVFHMFVDGDSQDGITGFYGVYFNNITTRGHIKYFMRHYQTNGGWLTGCYHNNINIGSGYTWGFFGAKDEDTMFESNYIGGGAMFYSNVQSQAAVSKNLFFITGSNVRIDNSLPWDYQYGVTHNNDYKTNGTKHKPVGFRYKKYSKLLVKDMAVPFDSYAEIINFPKNESNKKYLEERMKHFDSASVIGEIQVGDLVSGKVIPSYSMQENTLSDTLGKITYNRYTDELRIHTINGWRTLQYKEEPITVARNLHLDTTTPLVGTNLIETVTKGTMNIYDGRVPMDEWNENETWYTTRSVLPGDRYIFKRVQTKPHPTHSDFYVNLFVEGTANWDYESYHRLDFDSFEIVIGKRKATSGGQILILTGNFGASNDFYLVKQPNE